MPASMKCARVLTPFGYQVAAIDVRGCLHLSRRPRPPSATIVGESGMAAVIAVIAHWAVRLIRPHRRPSERTVGGERPCSLAIGSFIQRLFRIRSNAFGTAGWTWRRSMRAKWPRPKAGDMLQPHPWRKIFRARTLRFLSWLIPARC